MTRRKAAEAATEKAERGRRAKKGLLVVESPTKVRTLKRFLGDDYEIKASVGHVKDLPPKRLGVDVADDFRPEYVTVRGKGPVLKELKAAAARVEDVFLAPDPDREGEAIAWHIADELRRGRRPLRFHRVLFHELTERAVREALAHPGELNRARFESQQARRILDRLVGYEISPLLWEKVRRGLSAGRVQSVAVRMICDREREIRAFVPEEYWTLTARLEGAAPPPFEARLLARKGKKVRVPDEATARRIAAELEQAEYRVAKVEKKERRQHAPPPFITSTLQQEAARRLRYPARKTMMLAQRLYEGVELGVEGPVGLITYMRTDSTRVAAEAAAEARSYIGREFGTDFVPPKPPVYRQSKMAQGAHEAIRPTSVARTPREMAAFLDRDALALYELIWKRFVASQMSPAVLDQTRVDITAGPYLLRATGSVVRFPGFTVLYTEARDDNGKDGEEGDRRLPEVREGERLALRGIDPRQHFTQPPPRYTEASLIKALEERGIGRPSTYATILSTIRDKEYVRLENRRFYPEELGFLVTDLLTEHFPEIMDVSFTAAMERDLDSVEEGETSWLDVLRRFYGPFSERMAEARRRMRSVKREGIATDLVCDKCGASMVIKYGKSGEFLACSGYPDCRNTADFTRDERGGIQVVRPEAKAVGTCDKCGRPMVLKKGRFGEFLACSGYPDCDFTRPVSTGVACPEEGCDGELVKRRSRRGKDFYGCNRFPACRFAMWDPPVAGTCPLCGTRVLGLSVGKGGERVVRCPTRGCRYRKRVEADSGGGLQSGADPAI
ncbi:type I DNA topoisomerase [Dissulfurirhabdus thermomarina]|uniref:DNA topoisomerase 1 n=1 Tax=Dissulfurirhabdus thermomarina TaxID=1765737 RepID=A0A6N9TL66_DISTH|nr:type I DNA topoisomerase [Dissulfurirhabdus thermomarina]NDY41859.1 type I DNA topoisomerase [Dissulfurirhabdus thermomarina]NMX22615.1 type I DNA topoisomerase [Dissulfurirhabdus thermomarina]